MTSSPKMPAQQPTSDFGAGGDINMLGRSTFNRNRSIAPLIGDSMENLSAVPHQSIRRGPTGQALEEALPPIARPYAIPSLD